MATGAPQTESVAKSFSAKSQGWREQIATGGRLVDHPSLRNKVYRSNGPDIINRITWDPEFKRSEYIIGFVDRFEGQLEINMDNWKKDSTDEEFIPQHRILYIQRVGGGIVWDRRRRIDKIFMSGNSAFSELAFLILSRFMMDPFKSKRPSLPRLETDILPPHRLPPRPATLTLPLAPVPIPEISETNVRRIGTVPSLIFKEVTNEENLLPKARYDPDKAFYVTEKNVAEEQMVKKRPQQYYEEFFGGRDSSDPPRERIYQDSVLVAELKTSHAVKYERSKLARDFLSHLSLVYQRPGNSIMVTIQQDTCVLFGSNNTLSAYLLTIYALPSMIAPVTNVRSTALIQNTLEELLGIPPNLGVTIFIPVREENLATNGTTIRNEISMIERNEDSPSIFKSISRPSAAITASPSPHTPCERPASPREKELGTTGKEGGFRKRIFQLLKDKMTMEVEDKEATEAQEKKSKKGEAREDVVLEARSIENGAAATITETENG
ncbi:uncharacterized protein N7477_002172, partial [Penicillium maclennaniae]|uniref:uncharacterized protein n=1 Tax=Penicillium maclennaniae TaxID=1343394 RepID=UPI0025416CEC